MILRLELQLQAYPLRFKLRIQKLILATHSSHGPNITINTEEWFGIDHLLRLTNLRS